MVKRTLHLHAERAADLDQAAALLRSGALVAFATETVYGLGANALDPGAVEQVFRAKGRPAWDPLIVHLADAEQVSALVLELPGELQERVAALQRRFWPGPLTLLLPKREVVPATVTAGRPLVGIRVPEHPQARALLRGAGVPVAAPSANSFGHISPTSAAHVLSDLGGRIDAVLDAGPCALGVESTVLDPASTPMVIYREGGVSARDLHAACPGAGVVVYSGKAGNEAQEPLPSPGVGIRHYAPHVPVQLVPGSAEELRSQVLRAMARGQRVGVMQPTDWPAQNATGNPVCFAWGRWDRPDELAARLYAGLRSLEAAAVDRILCPLPEGGGLGDALRDRLGKAARSPDGVSA